MGRMKKSLSFGGEPLLIEDEAAPPSRGHYACFDYGGGPGWKQLSAFCISFAAATLILSWIPWFGGGRGHDTPQVWECIVAGILIFLAVASHVQAMVVDPGFVTPELSKWLCENYKHKYGDSGYPRAAQKFDEADAVGIAKPPRSHYDNVSKRLVYNMDHFCPWVGNTIGFRNRKFFMLLLFYTCLESWFLVGTTAAHFSDTSVYMLVMAAIALLLGISTLIFGSMHVKMMVKNQTTIEVKYGCKVNYDVGWYRNTQQVMGSHPCVWFLPIYGAGPEGDGINWPTQESTFDYANDGKYEGSGKEDYQDFYVAPTPV